MSVLSDELADLVGDLDDAKTHVATSNGPLQDPAAPAVAALLKSADDHIAAALALTALDGSVNEALPASLPAIADQCVTLAQSAHAEALKSSPDLQFITNRMNSIRWLIDANDGYRDRAGLS